MKRIKSLRITAVSLLVFLGLAAAGGGLLMLIDPSGGKIILPLDLLEETPFQDFFIPGLILFSVLGVFSFIIGWMTFLKSKYYEWFIIMQGFILSGWLTIEVLINSDLFFPAYHYPLYAISLLLILTGILLIKWNPGQSDKNKNDFEDNNVLPIIKSEKVIG